MKPTEKYNQIQKILDDLNRQNKDFVELNEKISKILKEIGENKDNLDKRKRKLINILLKHSKKKNLFEFVIKKDVNVTYGSDKKYGIGLNENGLGICQSNWENNLRNIGEYYSRDNFEDLLKNKEFVKVFLKEVNKHLKGKHKAIMRVLIELQEEKLSKTFDVGKIRIELGNYIQYQVNIGKDKVDFERISLVSAEDNGRFSFGELKNYCELIECKKEVKKKIKEEIKFFIQEGRKIKNKLARVDKELSPYEALAEI